MLALESKCFRHYFFFMDDFVCCCAKDNAEGEVCGGETISDIFFLGPVL